MACGQHGIGEILSMQEFNAPVIHHEWSIPLSFHLLVECNHDLGLIVYFSVKNIWREGKGMMR